MSHLFYDIYYQVFLKIPWIFILYFMVISWNIFVYEQFQRMFWTHFHLVKLMTNNMQNQGIFLIIIYELINGNMMVTSIQKFKKFEGFFILSQSGDH